MDEAHKTYTRTTTSTSLHDIEKAPPPRPRTLKSWFRQHQFRTLSSVAAIVIVLGIGLGIGLGFGIDSLSATTTPSPKLSKRLLSSALAPASCAATGLSASTSDKLQNNTALWQPAAGTPWQILLSRIVDASLPVVPVAPVYDVDMFGTPKETIAQLHQQGVKVICYFSAGSYENWRPDAANFKSEDLGHPLNGWPGESWLNTNNTNVRNIMAARIQMAAEKGCDAIDPDNMDSFELPHTITGFTLTPSSALHYLSFLSLTAASYNLSTGLKNAGPIAANATCLVEFAVVESCTANAECGVYQPFIAAGKPVFQIEYPYGSGAAAGVAATEVARLCKGQLKGGTPANGLGFSEVMKGRMLDGWVEYCDATVWNTAVVAGS